MVDFSFIVHGTDLEDVVTQADAWLAQLTERPVEYDVTNLEPVTVSMTGAVVAWSARISGEVKPVA